MELTTLSKLELQRLEIIQSILDKRLSVVDAGEHLGLSRSQVHRLLQRYRLNGAAGLASGKRGKPSNRKYPDTLRDYVLHTVQSKYHDFGPTLAAEKLEEVHELSISKETLRKWMIESGIWQSRIERKKRIHQPRNRRECFGELIQLDGSHHWWFEERGPKSALLVYIDDATSKLVHLRFAKSENAFDYFEGTKAYLARYGKPLAFYTDKHGVFRTTHGAKNKDVVTGMTQFGRALHELNIDIICANSPQAKGRVERANKTLQDRLVKELRLRNISTIEDANAYMSEFMAVFNTKFGKEPRNDKDMHRPLTELDSLDSSLCHKEERTLSNTLTLRYDKVLFILDKTDLAISLTRKRVTVCDYPDGRLEIQHNGVSMPYRTFDKLRSVNRAPVVENKRLDDMLAIVEQMQKGRALTRSQKAPRRTGQKGHIFEVKQD
jgi:transposase